MKKIVSLLIVGFALCNLFAQNNKSLGIDCNPRLNEQEIKYLSNLFSANNYDFKNKTIGFASRKVKRICRIPTFDVNGSWPITKKKYFTALALDSCGTTISKLFVLNDDQKKESRGFDAIVLIIPKKKEKKIDDKAGSWLAEDFGLRTLNYPDNLHLVGNDNSAELTDEDVKLFNRIYHDKGFDFKGKKIAFMNPHLDGEETIRTKMEFIEKIKKHLEKDFLYPASEDLEIFSSEEKKESGGYDAMIVYQSKRFYKDQLIKILKDSNTR